MLIQDTHLAKLLQPIIILFCLKNILIIIKTPIGILYSFFRILSRIQLFVKKNFFSNFLYSKIRDDIRMISGIVISKLEKVKNFKDMYSNNISKNISNNKVYKVISI